MNYTLLFLLFGFLACSEENVSSNNTISDGKWLLVWEDDFESSNLDLSKWNFELGAGGWGNNESQYYTNRPENAYLENGNLVIEARKENYLGSPYTSARLTTKNKGDWKYGRFEARAKLPKGQGIWPAIWMFPTNSKYGGWAASGEIDIMELIGSDPYTVHGTLHYGAEWPNNISSGTSYTLPQGSSFADGYHKFAIEWDSTSIKWYVDNTLYQTQTFWFSEGRQFPAPFNKEFFFILNIAVGGNWPGYPNNTTQFPQTMKIDYIRAYKLDPNYGQ